MSSTTTTTSTSSELAKALSKFDTKTTTEILLDGKVRGLIFSDENNKLFMEYKLLRKLSLVGNNIKSIDNLYKNRKKDYFFQVFFCKRIIFFEHDIFLCCNFKN